VCGALALKTCLKHVAVVLLVHYYGWSDELTDLIDVEICITAVIRVVRHLMIIIMLAVLVAINIVLCSSEHQDQECYIQEQYLTCVVTGIVSGVRDGLKVV
jgi:hypothetical protein